MSRKVPLIVLLAAWLLSACQPLPALVAGSATDAPVELRLAVSLLPEALADYQRGLAAIQQQHPSWQIHLEVVPQQGLAERFAAELSAGQLPDVILLPGLFAQQWIRQNAFADLTPLAQRDGVDLAAFYPDTVAQFAYNNRQWGIPNDAAPEVIFYNKSMFDAAGVAYPTDAWTFQDMRAAAARLTLDNRGRAATDPAFDAGHIVQWGWNSTPQHIWARHYLRGLGADYCANSDCTRISMTGPAVVAAFRWWADMAQHDHSAPYDVYSGAQTGVPGDPFLAGKAAMGFNNSAAIGQLNSQSQIKYDIVQPFRAPDGKRYGPLSTQGYVIAANSRHQAEAWQLVQALTTDQFLANYFARPGHGIPARRTAARDALDPTHPPANQQALLQALEYEEVFRPFTASALEAYAKTSGLFVRLMQGDGDLEQTLGRLEAEANAVLARDR